MGFELRAALAPVLLVWMTATWGCQADTAERPFDAGAVVEDGASPARETAPADYAAGDLIVSGTLVTMDERLNVEPGGRVYIQNGRIAAIIPPGEPLPPGTDGVSRVTTSGFVFPGLINIHNHLAYNVLPAWEMPDINGRPFDNRYNWREGLGDWAPVRESYSRSMTWPKSDLMDRGLAAEIGKWAELKELVAGTTSTQGSFSFRGRLSSGEASGGFERHLVRNVDLDGESRTRQSSSGIHDFRHPHALNTSLLESVLRDMDRGGTDAFLVHLSEGTDPRSREELYELNRFGLEEGRQCGPMMEKTVVIHGTPYESDEFSLMAECGTDLVAAPLSNLLYYGRAPNLADAVEAGVRVSLSTDWNPAGSKNLLVELKVADFLNQRLYGGRLNDSEMVRMVTTNPAASAGWGERAGRLAPGLVGDLLVIESDQESPYRALIEATEREVALVVVGGEPLYGDVDLMRALKPDDHEVIDSRCGFQKAVDLTTARANVEEGLQGFRHIRAVLGEGFQALDPVLRSRGLSPLYMCEDEIGLEAIRRSSNVAFFEPEISALPSVLDRYYAAGRSEGGPAGPHEGVEEVSEGDLPDLKTLAIQKAGSWPAGPDAERDGIFSLLAYATVVRNWQSSSERFDRGHNIGSLLVDDATGRIVFWARNAVFATGNAAQHAELRTMNCYLAQFEPASLEGYTLYTTLEPCPMCAGAMLLTRLTRTVYGQTDPAFGGTLGWLRDRLASNASSPYQTRAEASGIFHRYWLDLAYERYRRSRRFPNITQFLATPVARDIFEDGANTLRTYQARYPGNEETLELARRYLEGIPDGYVQTCKVAQ